MEITGLDIFASILLVLVMALGCWVFILKGQIRVCREANCQLRKEISIHENNQTIIDDGK